MILRLPKLRYEELTPRQKEVYDKHVARRDLRARTVRCVAPQPGAVREDVRDQQLHALRNRLNRNCFNGLMHERARCFVVCCAADHYRHAKAKVREALRQVL